MINPTRVITHCIPAIERFYVVGLYVVCGVLKRGGNKFLLISSLSHNFQVSFSVAFTPVDSCTTEGTALISQLHGAANTYARVSARVECDLRAGVHANAALFCVGRRRTRSRRHRGGSSCTARHLSSRPGDTCLLVLVEPQWSEGGTAEKTYFIRLHFRVARHFCF